MSKMAFCKRGGQMGISFTQKEAVDLGNILKSKTIDYIPLPDVELSKQLIRIKEAAEDEPVDRVEYWECENGSHGWCCTHTGKIVQWG